MDVLVNVVLVALATWQVTEVFHHSLLSLPIRRWAQANAQTGVVRAFMSKLIQCPFCHSHWFGGLLTVLLALALSGLPYCGWLRYVIYIFAAVRLANLGNDVFYEMTRSPKHDIEEENDDIEIDDDEPGDESADV